MIVFSTRITQPLSLSSDFPGEAFVFEAEADTNGI